MDRAKISLRLWNNRWQVSHSDNKWLANWMLPLGMNGDESSKGEKERAWQTEESAETKWNEDGVKRQRHRRGLGVGLGWGGGMGKGVPLGTRGNGYRSILGLIRTIFRSREREAIFFPGSVDEKRLYGQDATPKWWENKRISLRISLIYPFPSRSVSRLPFPIAPFSYSLSLSFLGVSRLTITLRLCLPEDWTRALLLAFLAEI